MAAIFPKGIPIGQIAEDSRQVEFGLYTEARVKLNANLGALEQVWVLIPMNCLKFHSHFARRVPRGVSAKPRLPGAAQFARRAN